MRGILCAADRSALVIVFMMSHYLKGVSYGALYRMNLDLYSISSTSVFKTKLNYWSNSYKPCNINYNVVWCDILLKRHFHSFLSIIRNKIIIDNIVLLLVVFACLVIVCAHNLFVFFSFVFFFFVYVYFLLYIVHYMYYLIWAPA